MSLGAIEVKGSTRTSSLTTALVAIAFFLSGAAALVYQVAWQRILALHTGIGIYSVAMITAAFMAGLGLGSHAGGVLSVRLEPRTALRAFALLELGVATFAAASPWLFYDLLYTRARGLYAEPWLAGLLHLASLVLPTTLMGMSLPFLVRAMVRTTAGAGRTIGFLYGINVAGASIGALVTPWVLMRFLGIRGAVFAGASASLLAGLTALLLRPPAPSPPSNGVCAPERASTEPVRRPFGLWLALYALGGFCALSLEILWFRIIDIGVKATAFTFGTVLAIYLLGLAAGSLTGADFADRWREPLRAFLVIQCVLVLWSLAAVALIAGLPVDLPVLSWYFDHWGERLGFRLGRTWDAGAFARLYVLAPIALYGPPTVLMGLSFTVLQRAVQDDPRTSGRKVGLLQAANIAGCMAGSLVVGLLLLSWIGTTGALRVIGGLGLVFAAVGIAAYGPLRSFLSLAAALVGVIVLLPSQEGLWLRLHGRVAGVDRALVEEDATAVVAITPERRGQWWVWMGGRTQSSLPFGGVHSQLGAVPAVVHPAPLDLAIIGLGSGDTAWAAGCRRETRSVTVFEIQAPQHRLLTALSADGRMRRLESFLRDPRMNLVHEDGRNVLGREDKLYDLIEADALLPDFAYSGSVYSVEFFRLAASKLKPGGVMCTWAPTHRVVASFSRVFPHVVAFRNARLLVGSNERLPVDIATWNARVAAPEVRRYLGGEIAASVLKVLQRAQALMPEDVPDVEPNEDLFPRDEFLSP